MRNKNLKLPDTPMQPWMKLMEISEDFEGVQWLQFADIDLLAFLAID